MEREIAVRAADDEKLIDSVRGGDARAFAELWSRHDRAAIRVARHVSNEGEAPAVVAEARTRIRQRMLAGGGPTGSFRSYLYITVHAVVMENRRAADAGVDPAEDLAADDGALALDRALTTAAFRSLPTLWQSVLWYLDVEGISPEHAAALLGTAARQLPVLAYRAREALRAAWLREHSAEASMRLVTRPAGLHPAGLHPAGLHPVGLHPVGLGASDLSAAA